MAKEYTNRHNYSEIIVNAIKYSHSRYKGDNTADYSVTELLKPPFQNALQKEHKDDITEDVSEWFYALRGNAIGELIEAANQGMGILTEERLSMDIKGFKISGAFDAYVDETLIDIKETSVWSIIHKSKYWDWQFQLNCYRMMLDDADIPVQQLKIIAFLRDWMPSKAKFTKDYPKSQVMEIAIPILKRSEMEKEIWQRCIRNKESGNLASCSEKERWQDKAKYAVMKNGRKSAVKLHATNASAEAHIEELNDLHYIEERVSQPRRCQDYCNVKQFCDYYKNEVNK